MTIEARTLLPIADQAVSVASEIIRTRAPGVVTAKGDRDMATEVDYTVEDAVREFLSRETPEIGFLGEEEGVSRMGDGLMWALDPVDGTANFLHGIPLCGVSLGLLDKDTSTLGVIDLPFLNLRYSAAEESGAFVNGSEIHVSDARELQSAIVAIGDYAVGEGADERNRPRLALTQELAARVQRIRMFGAAAIDLAWVADGKIDANIMLSNNPWDTAAGVIIAREAGATVVDLDGSPHSMTSHATIAASPGSWPTSWNSSLRRMRPAGPTGTLPNSSCRYQERPCAPPRGPTLRPEGRHGWVRTRAARRKPASLSMGSQLPCQPKPCNQLELCD